MGLPEVWFVVIAVLWTGFFVLEGFDFGVGMLHSVIARSETEQRVAINTIGPFWDGNEVWLVVGAAGIFAAFPSWYATWLSAGYLAILVLLVALILRGVSFEFRGKVDTGRWRRVWSMALSVGSLLTPFILGVALGDLLVGLPIDANQEYTGSFWTLFTGYGLSTGVTVVLLCLVHGAAFLALRTTGELRERARALGLALSWAAMVAVVVFGLWTLEIVDVGPVTYAALSLAPVAVLVGLVSLRGERELRAFVATTLAMAGTVGSLFGSLYPDVLISSTDPSNNLTVQNSASGHYALVVMTVVVAVVLPVVLAYQAYSYVVFRHRVGAPAVETGDVSVVLPHQRTDTPETHSDAAPVPPRRN